MILIVNKTVGLGVEHTETHLVSENATTRAQAISEITSFHSHIGELGHVAQLWPKDVAFGSCTFDMAHPRESAQLVVVQLLADQGLGLRQRQPSVGVAAAT